MVSTFFLVVVSPRNIFLVVIISGDSSLIWMFEKFFFLKHEELSPLAVMGRINRAGHFSLTDNHHYGKGPNTYDKLFAVCYTRQRDVGKEFFRKLILKIGNKKILIRGGPHQSATCPFHQSRKSQLFLCTLRLVDFEPATSPSHLTFSTTTPHTQFCLYFIFFSPILY